MATGLAKNAAATNSDALKQALIDCVKQEKADFMQVIKAFYSQGQRTREDYLALTDALIEAMNGVLNANDWDDSLFLRNALKPLKKIRDEAVALKKEATATMEDKQITLRDLAEDEMLVYISIFQSAGDSLRKWELQLSSLRSHLLGRPVYENEADVAKVIRQKLVQTSEAYVIVAIKKHDVENFAYQANRVDRCGNPLLTLKDTAVKPENIFEFVHQGRRYFFVDRKLIPRL
ncbi:MAG: Dot/Icm secretion system protein IcmQ [Coxiellaceae bacterium]|nr:Dot/Icm secretion system protein IcmQ [Coxiellaceae bacterium]